MKKMMIKVALLVAVVGALGFIGGCSSSQKKSAVIGGLLGAGLGAGIGGLIGKSAGSAIAGAAIGGVAGGGIAAAAGSDRDDVRDCKCCRRLQCERYTK